jgi:hypothetical protein
MIGGEKYGRIGDEAEIVFYYALKGTVSPV